MRKLNNAHAFPRLLTCLVGLEEIWTLRLPPLDSGPTSFTHYCSLDGQLPPGCLWQRRAHLCEFLVYVVSSRIVRATS